MRVLGSTSVSHQNHVKYTCHGRGNVESNTSYVWFVHFSKLCLSYMMQSKNLFENYDIIFSLYYFSYLYCQIVFCSDFFSDQSIIYIVKHCQILYY